ncbi:MAG TPA: tannase/feruloyl esterase family alpha/beta hydrolase [Streptosporangiaceae bacterium]|nr:tannase/feruloyl esterase family alpha/beta hydrolase [Streptosporangiaceae bacterium]
MKNPLCRALLVVLAAVALLAGGAPALAASGGRSVAPQAPSGSRCSVGYLQSQVHLAGLTVDSAGQNTTGTFSAPGQAPLTGLPAFCDVTLSQLDAAGNPMAIEVWLPSQWTGRFQGVGGSYYTCGINHPELAAAIDGGYSAGSTDCGVPPSGALTGAWALKPNGTLNWPLIDDFGYAGIHDMSVAGKAVTRAYYPSALRFSYFNGCSTGGREGLMEAQRYPSDYNGIAAGSPAINWARFVPAEIWPQLVMNESHTFLPMCIENAFVDSAVRACGSTNGVITNPSACDWNPDALVGTATPCGIITRQDAAVMERIWQGPVAASGKRLWYGLERGASMSALAATTTNASGVTSGIPFPITVGYLGTWLLKDPAWNWQTLTYGQFDRLFARSVSTFSKAVGTDNPDLSAFRHRGGKLVIWHGLADQEIFPQGTVNYYQRVRKAMGGPAATNAFARLFLAPGAQHCASGAGPAPAPGQPLASVVNWVELGVAPASIPGETIDPATGAVTGSRPLCRYPGFARYTGRGSPAQASSFVCTG